MLTPPAHIRSSVTITNNTNSVLPIGAGVKLQANQTRTFNVSSVQLQEELVPRLEKLHLAGKVNYFLTPGTPQDVGAAGGLGLAGAGQQTTLPAVSIPSPAALAQTAWYINPLTGSDNNTGTAATQGSGLVGPIKTAAEYVRRTGLNRPIRNPVDIYIAADLPSTDTLIITGTVSDAGYIRWHGTNLAISRSGTLTGYTAPVAATNTLPSVTDVLVADWTADAGKLLQLTSGPQSAADGVMWIVKNLGGNAARVSQPANRNGNYNSVSFAPDGTETYNIVTPRLLGGGLILDVRGSGSASYGTSRIPVACDYVKVASSSPVFTDFTASGFFRCYGCQFDGLALKGVGYGVPIFGNCQFSIYLVASGASFSAQGGYLNATYVQLDCSTFLVTATPIHIRAGSLNYLPGSTMYADNTDIQIADTTNYFTLTNRGFLSLGANVYGVQDLGTLYRIGSGCQMVVAAPANLRIGGAVNDIKVAGKTQIFPIVTATGVPAAAVQTCSLANFANAGIFNGNIIDPFTGTSVLTRA